MRKGRGRGGGRGCDVPWGADDNQPMFAYQGVKTEADGQFTLDVEFYGSDQVVMAVKGDRGGPRWSVLDRRGSRSRSRWDRSSRSRGTSPAPSREHARLDQRVPPREARRRSVRPVHVQGVEVPTQGPARLVRLLGLRQLDRLHERETRHALKAGTPAVDLGPIDLKLKPLAKLYGKEPPPLKVTDARGVDKNVKLSDYKGKWVVLEFLGILVRPLRRTRALELGRLRRGARRRPRQACHPGRPRPQATDFAMLDERLKPVIQEYWHGKPCRCRSCSTPRAKRSRTTGSWSWPTAVLINPEGSSSGSRTRCPRSTSMLNSRRRPRPEARPRARP